MLRPHSQTLVVARIRCLWASVSPRQVPLVGLVPWRRKHMMRLAAWVVRGVVNHHGSRPVAPATPLCRRHTHAHLMLWRCQRDELLMQPQRHGLEAGGRGSHPRQAR